MEIKDVENLAELAKLELSDADKESFLKDMNGILDYIKQIESLDVGDIEVQDSIQNVWREDVLESREFSKEIIMKQFPEIQDDFLKVKKIL